jgi:uncharacterized membrane protein (DUF2068 family)
MGRIMRRPVDLGLRLIAVFELVKGTLVTIGAFALLSLIHKDIGAILDDWLLRFRVDADNHYVHMLIARVSGVTPRQLEAVSAGSLVYAAIRYVEGFGLLWRQRWAAYVTAIATAAFIPLEVIALNAAVVWYLVWRLRLERRPISAAPARLP